MGIHSNEFEILRSQFFKHLQHNRLDQVKSVLKVIERTSCKDVTLVDKKEDGVIDSLVFDKSGDTALHICARLGPEFLELFRFLVEEKGASIEKTNCEGKTPLHDAALFSNYPVLKYLLDTGAKVNVVKRADWTPLMLACTKQDVDGVRLLLDSRANLFFVNKDGWNCCHIAAREGSAEIVKLLLSSLQNPQEAKRLTQLKSRNGRKPIHTAAMHGHLGVIKVIAELSTPEEMNEEDHCGMTPLMDACRFGHVPVIHYLVKAASADLNKFNKSGQNCLHIAAEAGRSSVVQDLVENFRMDVNLPSALPLQLTALHWTAKEGHSDTFKLLKQLKAIMDCKDGKGRTALEVATTFGKELI